MLNIIKNKEDILKRSNKECFMNNIDTLDRQILRVLTKDARTPYAEMAKSFGVSQVRFMFA